MPNTALQFSAFIFAISWLYRRSSMNGIRPEMLFASFSRVSYSDFISLTQLWMYTGSPTVSSPAGISVVASTS